MEEFKDTIKKMLGSTACEYLNYFTVRFPELMIHCYNTVEAVDAKENFKDYFNQDDESDDDSDNKPSGNSDGKSGGSSDEKSDRKPDERPDGKHDASGDCLPVSKMTISCYRDTIFPHTKVEFNTLVLRNISHIFGEGKKTFSFFLQKNGANITNLKFSRGSLKFESLNKILLKLPNLQKIVFDEIKYEVSKKSQTIKETTCQNLMELSIRSSDKSSLLQAFKEYKNIVLDIQDLDLDGSKSITHQEIDKTSLFPATNALKATVAVIKPSGLDWDESKLKKLDLPSTSTSMRFKILPEPKRSNTTPPKSVLEALYDGSIDMELLKRICRGCLAGLQEKHAKGKCQTF